MGQRPTAQPQRTIENPASARRVDLPLTVCIAGVVLVASFAAFWPALSGDFSGFDDVYMLIGSDKYRALGAEILAWMFTSTLMGHYQPLTWVSYAIDYQIWGLEPRGFHLTNMVIHALNAVLVFWLAARLVRAATGVSDRWTLLGAGVAALLFGIHPLRAESVAWITERRDVLSTFFLLLTTHAYLSAFAVSEARTASPRWYAASVALLLLSLLSKAWGMSFFVVALVLDVYPLRRLDWRPWRWIDGPGRAVLVQKAPYAALGVVFAFVAAWAQSSAVNNAASLERWGVPERTVQAFYGLMFYAWKTVWPTSLSPIYELPMRISPWEARFVAAYAVVAGACVLLFFLRKRAPGAWAAAAVYVVLLLPVLGFFQSGIQLVADRYSYLACIGWAVLAGELISRALRRASLRGKLATGVRVVLGSVVVCGLLGVLTWRQSEVWRTTESVFTRPIALGTAGPVARTMYAKQLDAQGRTAEALEQFHLALQQVPDYFIGWYTFANFLRDHQMYAEATEAYRTAAKGLPEPWAAYVGLGEVYLVYTHEPAKAVEAFRSAVADVERTDRPRGSVPGGGGTPYLMLAAALYETGDLRGCRAALVKGAEYPQRREAILERLGELDAELAEQKRDGK